ncbi:MAG: GntR family transcriptional regulator [Lachnospiraceae bacterium]|nr:GntR family transcriptional regulator [Lachnospiraceae bacterium]
MPWKFDANSPIYLQIMDELKLKIAKGELNPGDKVPAVRELAIIAGVNPNTMQKALSELEREGVLYSQRTSGRFVAELGNGQADIRQGIYKQYMDTFVRGMRELGFANDDIIKILEKYFDEEE